MKNESSKKNIEHIAKYYLDECRKINLPLDENIEALIHLLSSSLSVYNLKDKEIDKITDIINKDIKETTIHAWENYKND